MAKPIAADIADQRRTGLLGYDDSSRKRKFGIAALRSSGSGGSIDGYNGEHWNRITGAVPRFAACRKAFATTRISLLMHHLIDQSGETV